MNHELHPHHYRYKQIAVASVVFIVAFALFFFGFFYFFGADGAQNPNQTACTAEAKLCPDGSAVGRTGPNCEFAACPGVSETNTPGWQPLFDFEFVEEVFSNKKVVYKNNAIYSEIIEHCEMLGGEFNQCGSPCASGAEVCIAVCAYTCEIP